ncbi:MAG: zinc-dependent alcohol dehydrogenase family protein [Gammaproteobacteria bacterium]|nr:zinc-dependent alcohol dehydrogenase family protein [Gammaproteobacteria bacterium]
MQLVEFGRYGTPHEVCTCADKPEFGDPGPGEVIVAVEAAAINPADLLIIEGRYPGPAELPAPVGIEGAGRVTQVGAGVSDLQPGQHVMLLSRANWAEQVKVPADQAIAIPEDLDILDAAQIKANPPSARLMLDDYGALKPGDWVIQNAANSAVGRHLVRLARHQGIKTVNVVRRESAVQALLDIGADLVLVDGDDLGARVRAEIGTANLPLAIDAIGGHACLHLADCLSDGGTVVNYGFLSGEPCMLHPSHAIVHGIDLQGFWLVKRLFQRPRETIEATYAEIAVLFKEGVLIAPVEATYTLAQLEDALRHAEQGNRDGKIVLTPNGPVT